MFRSLFPSGGGRSHRTLASVSAGLVLGCLCVVGCGRPTSSVSQDGEQQLDVERRTGETDPGRLVNEPITPPDVDVDLTRDGAGTAEATDPAALPEQQDRTTEKQSWTDWSEPSAVLVVSGQQHGYIEPCGCTGLENQKGGMARRMTLIKQLQDRGWNVVPIDGGNQVRRIGRQAEIKFQTTATGLEEMGYRAVGFGPDDLRLSIGELLSVSAGEPDDPSMFASSNVTLLDPELMQRVKQLKAGGKTIAVTSVLDPEAVDYETGGEVMVTPVDEALSAVADELKAIDADYRVLTFFGREEAAVEAIQGNDEVQFDLVVVVGGYGEPTYRPQSIPGTETEMIFTGDKGMYVGLVGLFPDGSMRYSRVALTDAFADAPSMLDLLASYQEQLKALGLEGLGLHPIPHPSGDRFVGSETCGECHTTAFAIWEGTPHSHATESLVHPPNSRSEIPRHFDPECLSCHVTGWNPQNYYPYTSGYLSLDKSQHLLGSGCENCHGPGAEHVAAESGEADVSQDRLLALRDRMRLPLSEAKERCMECHDLDNSPDFHKPGAFEDVYWPEVEHYGMD